jgi:hypothetical protein
MATLVVSGNTVVWNPSLSAVQSAVRIGALFERLGRGVVNLLLGDDAVAVRLAHSGLTGISVVGNRSAAAWFRRLVADGGGELDADVGGSDPTSVSIGLDPAGQQDLMPAGALKLTFDRYLAEVRLRDKPDALYAYTPYEMRNVLTYVRLNQPREAEELLQSLVRHRRPLEWQVLAEVIHSRERYNGYLGDMPHTWIGAEYARTIFGMLAQQDLDRLTLLAGAPPSWVAGKGLSVSKLPTAFGPLTMTADQNDKRLRVALGAGLRKDTALTVNWPSREKPARVTVDGKATTDYDANGIRLQKPFKELVAQW